MQPSSNPELLKAAQTPDFDLKPALDDQGRLSYEHLPVDLVTDDDFAPANIVNANRSRLGVVHNAVQPPLNNGRITCEAARLMATGVAPQKTEEEWRVLAKAAQTRVYQTVGGSWVIEKRTGINGNTPFDYQKRESEVVGATANPSFLRASDAGLKNFPAAVAMLEKQGNTVSAVTDRHPHGTYIGDGVNKAGQLSGYALQDESLQAVKVQSIGVSTLSRKPQIPSLEGAGLNFIHTHGMGLALYEGGKWGQSHIAPSGEIATNMADASGVQYAQAVFEGGQAEALKAGLSDEDATHEAFELMATDSDSQFVPVDVDTEGNVSIFRLDAHAKRFNQSSIAMKIPPVDEEQFKQTIIETVKANKAYIPQKGGRLYIRPWAAGIGGGKGANPAAKYVFGVSVLPFADYYKAGDSMKVEVRPDIHRPDSGADKAAGNYAPGFMAKADAKKRGYSDILCVDREGNVEEFGAAAVVFIKEDSDGKLTLVAPMTRSEKQALGAQSTSNILDSINRKSAIEIARAMGITVEVRDIHYQEIKSMQGAICIGTAAGIVPITQMDIADGRGPSQPCTLGSEEAVKKFIYELDKNYKLSKQAALKDDNLVQFNSFATLV